MDMVIGLIVYSCIVLFMILTVIIQNKLNQIINKESIEDDPLSYTSKYHKIQCPHCGRIIEVEELDWVEENYFDCPYCGEEVIIYTAEEILDDEN